MWSRLVPNVVEYKRWNILYYDFTLKFTEADFRNVSRIIFRYSMDNNLNIK